MAEDKMQNEIEVSAHLARLDQYPDKTGVVLTQSL